MEQLFLLLFMVFALMLVGGAVQAWQKNRKDKLRVLEEAIRSPDIDPDTKRAIIHSMQGGLPKIGARLFFGAGWLGFFLGIGFVITGDRHLEETGVIISTLGFALLTLPLAYREVESRRRA